MRHNSLVLLTRLPTKAKRMEWEISLFGSDEHLNVHVCSERKTLPQDRISEGYHKFHLTESVGPNHRLHYNCWNHIKLSKDLTEEDMCLIGLFDVPKPNQKTKQANLKITVVEKNSCCDHHKQSAPKNFPSGKGLSVLYRSGLTSDKNDCPRTGC